MCMMISQVTASYPQTHQSSRNECCLFYKFLPTECICHILQFYGEMTVKQLAKFSSMTSGLHTAIFSKNLGLFLPPICLCDPIQCTMSSCGREKVPMLFYKKILSEGCSLSKKANLHIYSDISTVGDLAESIHKLIGGCRETINDLFLQISIGIQSDNQTTIFESSVDKSITMNECGIGDDGGNSPTSIINLQEVLESFPYRKEITFPNLQKLLVNIEYSRIGDEILTGSICISILSAFGLNLQQLSIFASSVQSRMNENESNITQYSKDERKRLMRHQYDVNESPFVALCPLLTRLELFGCSTALFSNESTCDTKFLKSNTHNHVCSQCPERKNSICLYSAALNNENKIIFNFPNLSTVEVEENFQSADEIFSIINCISPSMINILLIGNTSKYINDILGFFNVNLKGKFKCLEILEIHDSCPWPFSDNEINNLETSVADIFIVCPLLKRIVMSTVQVSDDVYLCLSNKGLMVTQERLNYSTVITRKNASYE